MIDYTNKNYAGSKFYEEAVKRWAPFTGTNYEIGVTISGRPVEIYALLGGQWPHSSYMVPGGVMCAPTLTDVTRSWSILREFPPRVAGADLARLLAGALSKRSNPMTISSPGSTSGPSTPIPTLACSGA